MAHSSAPLTTIPGLGLLQSSSLSQQQPRDEDAAAQAQDAIPTALSNPADAPVEGIEAKADVKTTADASSPVVDNEGHGATTTQDGRMREMNIPVAGTADLTAQSATADDQSSENFGGKHEEQAQYEPMLAMGIDHVACESLHESKDIDNQASPGKLSPGDDQLQHPEKAGKHDIEEISTAPGQDSLELAGSTNQSLKIQDSISDEANDEGSHEQPPTMEGNTPTEIEPSTALSHNLQNCINSHSVTGSDTNPKDFDLVEVAAIQKDTPGAEWELDSSVESDSDSSDSSDASSSDNGSDSEDEETDYPLLGAEEQARLLMQEDGDGGRPQSSGKQASQTKSAFQDVKVVKPDIEITEDMEIFPLGDVMQIVENYLMIKGKVSGQMQIWDTGSVVCLADRSVLGVIEDNIGRVDTPFYSVAFTNADELHRSGASVGTEIFYVAKHSQPIFTEPLRSQRWTDASNDIDEAASGEDPEFSDDEAEAAYKAAKKEKKRKERTGANAIQTDRKQRPRNRGGRPNQNSPRGQYPDVTMKYDDDDDTADNLYTPLARPGAERSLPPRPPQQGFDSHQRGGQTRGRGGRGRGDRGFRGGRGRGGGRENERPQSRGHQYEGGHPQPYVSRSSPQAMPRQGSFQSSSFGPFPIGGMQGNSWNQHSQMPMPPQALYQQFQFQQGQFQQNQYQMPPQFQPGTFINPSFFENQGQSPNQSQSQQPSSGLPPGAHQPKQYPFNQQQQYR